MRFSVIRLLDAKPGVSEQARHLSHRLVVDMRYVILDDEVVVFHIYTANIETEMDDEIFIEWTIVRKST